MNLRKYGKIQYYDRRKGGEIDFILDEKTAVEVKNKAVDQHIKDLRRTSKALHVKNHYVISNQFVDGSSVILAQDL